MFIDEGFLNNAKKIASQPQNSEVKVPVIRRENYGYHVSFGLGDIENKTKEYIRRIISSCEIFKEHSDISITSGKENDMTEGYVNFDADMFITPDTILEMVCKSSKPGIFIQLITISNTESDDKIEISHSMLSDAMIYLLNNNIRGSLINKHTTKILHKILIAFGISPKNEFRWLRRNEITPIINIPAHNFVYPIYMENGDFISSLSFSEFEIYNGSESDSLKIPEIKKYIDFNRIKKYILSYDEEFNINIQIAEPIYLNYQYYNEPVWISSKIYMHKNTYNSPQEYKMTHELINQTESATYDDDIINNEYVVYTPVTAPETVHTETYSTDRYLLIQVKYKKEPDKEELTENIKNSKFIINKEDVKSLLTHKTEINKNIYVYSLYTDSKLSSDPQKAYDLFRSFGHTEGIKIKSKGNITTKARINYRQYICPKFKFPEKDKMYIREYGTESSYMNEIMQTLGISEKDIAEWNIRNNIVRIPIKFIYPIFIESTDELSTSTQETMEQQIGKDWKSSYGKYIPIIKEIEKNDIHKFMINDIDRYDNTINITTLYPVPYKDTYIYPTFKKIIREDEYDKYIDIFRNLMNYRIYEGENTSELVFTDIEGNIRATGKDNTK